ncbi:hypothetical protein HOBO_170 [Bacillus phage Hobo]|uniref:Uncharacterized protein n=2 Tax=Caeruleovirus BM15 TaxID=1985178 RepID=A0A0S2MUP0_9CAUD|nr:hypothetical protein FD732_gp172 [Bacillus phage BM15]ALO79577.1 hypothetical protein BM10_173 [Bacillus phage BM15]AXQ66928.1 hypothetical protein HOBO_170 [Bacillus phage Hobo]
MNLYRQITAEELRDEINVVYSNALIRDEKDREVVLHAVKMMSRREAKQAIRKYFHDSRDCSEFYNRIKKLYFALEWVQSGTPVYTDYIREDD